MKKFISVFLCLTMLFGICSLSAGAYTVADNSYFEGVDIENGKPAENFNKLFYNSLNVFVEKLAKFICLIYPDNINWEKIEHYSGKADGFMPGRAGYIKEAAPENRWKMGFAELSIIPDDISCGKYNIGRYLTNKYAKGVYDGQNIRISVIDDNSGRGYVIMGDIDAMGITSKDVREIRKGIMKNAQEKGIKIASINISATHSHSVLDVQGISTEFIYKLLFMKYNNLFGTPDRSGKLKYAEKFKELFIAKGIECAELALNDMETGRLYYGAVDMSNFIRDKRGLIDSKDLQKTAVLRFEPDSGTEKTYIADISCHPTSFNADYQLVGSDYIYYLEEYIKNNDNNSNTIMIPGVLGQIGSNNIDVDWDGLTEYESMGAKVKATGYIFGRLILENKNWEELEPLINVTHREIFIRPGNSVLALACEISLVNNKVYKEGINDVIPTEMGYLEFGRKIAFFLSPGELYPEVFLGDKIAGCPTWDGKQWPYGPLNTAVPGVDIYAASLCNDSLGYVLTDNNFAFMGHILGDNISDEILSCGKNMGSYLVEQYYYMIDGYVK